MKESLLYSTAATLVLRTTSAGLGFATYVALARWLGVAEYGRFTFAMTWIWLLAGLGVLGLDKILVRYIAAYSAQESWDLLKGVLSWSNRAVWLVSIALAGLIFGYLAIFHLHSNGIMGTALPFVAVATPVVILLQTRQAILRGFHQIILSQVPDTLIQPVLLLCGLSAALWAVHGRLTAEHALFTFISATVVAVIMASGFLRAALPLSLQSASVRTDVRAWIMSAAPLILVSGMTLVNEQFDILFLGSWHGARAVGVYAVAKRGAALIAFGITAANFALAPTFARLHADGNRERLQSLVTQSSRWVLLLTTVIAAGMIVGGRLFLSVFGPAFTQGQTTLTILIMGQWINAAMGPVASLLIMTGHERDVAIGIGASTAVNLLLNAIFIPRLGIVGAAGSAAIGMTIWNLILASFVGRRLGFSTTAWGK